LQALGTITSDLDPLLQKILKNAETLFLPKKINGDWDWLIDHKEKPQTFNLYNRPGVRNEVTPARNKIYIFVTDDRIKPDFLEKLKKYCLAFYYGMNIEIMYPKGSRNATEFMASLEIPSREG